MDESLPMQHTASWEHRAEHPVEHLAVSPAADLVLAADADRCLLVLGSDGEPQGTFTTTYPVAGVWAELRGEWFAALADLRSVGVMGDGRTYQQPIILRAVTTDDFMTADWADLPHEVLSRISNRIVNEVRGVNRVLYDITSKPPATIEWE